MWQVTLVRHLSCKVCIEARHQLSTIERIFASVTIPNKQNASTWQIHNQQLVDERFVALTSRDMLGFQSSCLIIISLNVMLPKTTVMSPEMLLSHVAQNFLKLKYIFTSCYTFVTLVLFYYGQQNEILCSTCFWCLFCLIKSIKNKKYYTPIILVLYLTRDLHNNNSNLIIQPLILRSPQALHINDKKLNFKIMYNQI